MPLLGINLTILIGQSVPRPAPTSLVQALEQIEVTQTDEGRSGFQLTFQVGREPEGDSLDYSLLSNSLLDPFNRVIIIVTIKAMPKVLIDGMITYQQALPSNEPGESRLVIMGEDVSVMMDLEEKIVSHPAQNNLVIVNKIIASYARYGLVPKVIPASTDPAPLPTDHAPIQHGTDLDYLLALAKRHGYVFYVSPGLAPGTNIAYWGPPVRLGVPQPALSFNLGSFTNVETIQIRHNALSAATVSGSVQDRKTNQVQPISINSSSRKPAFARNPALSSQVKLRQFLSTELGGLTGAEATARGQGTVDKSVDAVVTAEGELDGFAYGDILQARGIVGLRGVGQEFDGNYYVKRVTHRIAAGDYKQRFTLTREGLGSIMPIVRA